MNPMEVLVCMHVFLFFPCRRASGKPEKPFRGNLAPLKSMARLPHASAGSTLQIGILPAGNYNSKTGKMVWLMRDGEEGAGEDFWEEKWQ